MRYQRQALLFILAITGSSLLLHASNFPPAKKNVHVNQAGIAGLDSRLPGKTIYHTAPVKTHGAIDSADLFVDFTWFNLTTCLPQTIQFIDNSMAINDAMIAEWYWDFGDGSISTDQYPSHDYTQHGNYTVKLTIKDTSGGSATYSQVLVVATSTPTVTLRSDTSVCAGMKVLLDAGPQPGCSYIWNTGDTSRKILAAATDDYWVQVYNSSCAASAFVHITVNPRLTSAFTYNQLGTCLPVSVQFNDQSTSCGPYIVSRIWDFGDGDTSSLANPVHIYTEGKTYTVTLSVKDNGGLTVSSSQTITINVNTPLVNLGKDTTVCYGNPVVLDAGTLGESYLWGNGATTQTITIADAGVYWVKVYKDGCYGWDSIVVKTTFPMLADFNADITGQCLPVTVHFKDNSGIVCGSVPITGWSWDFGDGATSTSRNPDHIYTQAGKFNVKLTIRNAGGMTLTKTNPITITTIGPVKGLLPDVTICQGEKTQLNASNEGASFTWSPTAPLNSSTIQNPVAAPTITTAFIATISKCGVTLKDTVIVYVDSIPRPVISQVEGMNTLTSTLAASYKWYKDGVLIDGAINKTYRPTNMGYYQVMVTNQRGCSNMSARFFFLPGDGRPVEGNGQVKIKLSPNPSHGIIDILFSKAPEKPVRVEIYDAFGKQVYQGYISSNVNTINLGNLHKGQHFVQLYIKDQNIVLPFQLL